MANAVIISDGSADWSKGVDSLASPTIASPMSPDGLARNELAWIVNAGVRTGGITQRAGWQPQGTIRDGNAIYQGCFMYQPIDGGTPYLIMSIGGHIYKVDPSFLAPPLDLSVVFGLFNPANLTQSYFTQGEEFLIIQAGDGTTLPLFWDNAILRRSIGITNPTIPTPAPNVNELPASGPMDYYMNRIWYGRNRNYAAGDVVGNKNSGTAPYNYRDSILNVTESPLAFGGDGFSVPTNAGTIRGITHEVQLDASLAQGRLLIGTNKSIYALTVPVSRADWISTTSTNQPLQVVVSKSNGWVNDRSLVHVNSDIFFQSLEPNIRSYISGLRYFGTWQNTPVGSNEQRILDFEDRNLLRFISGIYFDNRLLMTALPKQTPQGVVHTAIVPLDFSPISTFDKDAPPAWEGHYEGLQVLQVSVGDFGGLERAFAVTVNELSSDIELWEITQSDRFENGDNRVTWIIEFPAFTWAQQGREFDLKKLVSASVWVDRVFGTVDLQMQYRPDQYTCWQDWKRWSECAARNCQEDVNNPCGSNGYPVPNNYREQYRSGMALPLPPNTCNPLSGRPMNVAFQMQPRLIITGFCRLRGLLLHAEVVERALYDNTVCAPFTTRRPAFVPPAPTPTPTPPIPVLGEGFNILGDDQGNILGG